MSGDLIFFLGLSLLLTHEMDAIRRHEWRIFPLTAPLSDSLGYLVFTAAHVPLYALTLWALSGADEAIRSNTIVGLDLFSVAHVLLHIAFRKHPAYEFSGLFSRGLIGGAGLCGLADLAGRALALY
jgi:hypothetical protein